jgi:hypothetical protein
VGDRKRAQWFSHSLPLDPNKKTLLTAFTANRVCDK